MGDYLVCEKCNGIYELQEGENPFDFLLKCDCGGKLKYAKNIEKIAQIEAEIPQKLSDEDIKSRKKSIFDHGPLPFNITSILIFSIYIILIVGIIGDSMYFMFLGIFNLLLGIILISNDSWKLYLIIFSSWTVGGLFAIQETNFLGVFFGFIVIVLGGVNFILYIDKSRKKRLSQKSKNKIVI